MSEPNSIRFLFDRIVTDQFAVIDGIFLLGLPISISSHLEFSFADKEPIIKVGGSFSFLQTEKVFLKISVSCFFRIHPDDWKIIYRDSENRFLLPQNPALHLGSLVVGVARGVLHAKIEKEPFNIIVLPTINVHDHIKEDLEVKLASKPEEKAY